MIVSHFNRDRRPGNYTFEQLFSCIRQQLNGKVDILNYDLPENLNPLQAIIWAQKRKGEINHVTGDVNFLTYGLPSSKTILTVHDLGHYIFTLKGWRKSVYKKFWLEKPFRKVRKLTAISNFTKTQMVELLRVPEEKIEVIPNPLLPGIEFNCKQKFNEKPIILQIGSGRNKNLARLIEAVKGLSVKLLLVNKLFDSSLKECLVSSGVEYEQRVDLDFNGLRQAYIDSDLFFFASEYEGFGMPILEAQATGRPLITSNIASMPEAAGKDGAIFVDPYSLKEIRKAILDILSSKDRRDQLITSGQANCKKYEASRISDLYLQLYKTM